MRRRLAAWCRFLAEFLEPRSGILAGSIPASLHAGATFDSGIGVIALHPPVLWDDSSLWWPSDGPEIGSCGWVTLGPPNETEALAGNGEELHDLCGLNGEGI